jgi:hypothetical protein
MKFFQDFTDYTSVYQQQETGHGAHKNSSIVDIDSLSLENYPVIGVCHIVPFSTNVRDEYSYNFTPLWGGKYGLFYF